ncbi:MAG: DUF2934 domain-containing protein [Bryobacteraceae bacterium]
MPRKTSTDSSPVVPKAAVAAMPVKETAISRKKASAVTHKHKKSIAAEPESSSPAPRPTHDEIARLAYSYWEARGGATGSQEEDWLRAEAELQARAS